MNDKKSVILIKDVTKDYGSNRGNFNINLDIKEGETLGIVGENGAGKTTLIRQIMGFIKSDNGNIKIYNYDAYKDSALTKLYIGYIPGEINFPDVKTGSLFLHNYGMSLGMKENDFEYANELISRMQLDIRAYPKRMSKGMKQKTAIVSAIMLKAPILIMDEPSIGLDPLMREELLKLILEQKERGATMLISSNTIEELERVCDKVAYMSNGRIIDVAVVSDIKNRKERDYKIEFENKSDYQKFIKNRKDIIRKQEEYNQLTIRINKNNIDELFKELTKYKVKFISEIKYNLTTYFAERRKALTKEDK
ncbi:MAG TPA: ABC transporter ATP-binding protein [Firmicutes bacterium]|nr:ABC transporter ATP-binding protein [Bacillota bacterium]